MNGQFQRDLAIHQLIIGIFFFVVGLIVVYLLLKISNNWYSDSLEDCINNGNSKEYCIMMLE